MNIFDLVNGKITPSDKEFNKYRSKILVIKRMVDEIKQEVEDDGFELAYILDFCVYNKISDKHPSLPFIVGQKELLLQLLVYLLKTVKESDDSFIEV